MMNATPRNWSGKVSIVAHSLGAIICFDIMANQPGSETFSRPFAAKKDTRIPPTHVPANPTTADESNSDVAVDDATGPRGPEGMISGQGLPAGGEPGTQGGDAGEGCMGYYRGSTKFSKLSARVENVFCLGSPIGMFLMIRGQHRRLGKAFRLPG